MVQFIRMDRRPLPRFVFRCEVELSQNGSGAPLRGVISDISVSGCYVETITPEPAGTRLELRFQVNGQPMRFPDWCELSTRPWEWGLNLSTWAPKTKPACKSWFRHSPEILCRSQSASQPLLVPNRFQIFTG